MMSAQTSNHSPIIVAAVWAALMVSLPALAQRESSTDIEITQTLPETTTSSLSELERTRADTWQLSETEWHRYQSLMLGIRGSVSHANLSPIEVLGIHARDNAERRRYAERWAGAMREDAERVLAFQRAYDAAAEHLFSGQPLIDAGKLKTLPRTTSALRSGDRLLFFTAIECPACDAMLVKLLSHLRTVAGIDIYLTGIPDKDSDRIRLWADEHSIDTQWVQTRHVTLNFDAGLLRTIADDVVETPALFVRRNEQLTRLSYSDL